VEGFSRMQVPADLLIVGGNWSDAGFPQELKQEVAQLGLSDRIFLENHRLDVAALLDDCDVFVLPSLSEARPRSIIEAMFLGKPVLASAVGGIPTLVEDGVTGVLVPPGNVEALARALDGLAANAGLRGRLGASAHEWAHSEVRPETAAARLAELYRRLAGGQGLGTSSVSKRPPGC
jgi:glycosyltransferase involved in cell wall biosynthesis